MNCLPSADAVVLVALGSGLVSFIAGVCVQQLLNDARWLSDQLELAWRHIEEMQPREVA